MLPLIVPAGIPPGIFQAIITLPTGLAGRRQNYSHPAAPITARNAPKNSAARISVNSSAWFKRRFSSRRASFTRRSVFIGCSFFTSRTLLPLFFCLLLPIRLKSGTRFLPYSTGSTHFLTILHGASFRFSCIPSAFCLFPVPGTLNISRPAPDLPL